MRLIEAGTNFRSTYFSLPYGDQGLFMYRHVFKSLGQFPCTVFMEDFDFVVAARRLGRVQILKLVLLTSARRWDTQGLLWNTLRNQVL
jgi:hypothetical protein